MSYSGFGAFITIESSPQITNPAAVVRKDKQGIAHCPSDNELDEIQWGKSSRPPSIPTTGIQTPITPSDLESSNPPTPMKNGAVDPIQSLSNPSKNRLRLLSACMMNFASGLNDSAPGALIPYIEKEYHIGYAIVSLIFVTNAVGFILAAPCTHAFETRLGRSKTYIFSASLLAAGYIMIICKPPFPVVVTSFFLLGFGMALNLALNNVFCANLANSTAALGGLHGSYGIGGTIGPLIATALASHGVPWSFYYTITLAMSLCNLVLAAYAFRGYEKDLPVQLMTALERTASRQTHGAGKTSKTQLLKQALENKVTVIGALFIFAYQGAEVSISGWVVSFLISYRNGDPSNVGYVSAGFWAGITIGRFVLSHPAHRIGEKLAVVLLVAGAVAFQLLTWLIPNILGEAVMVSIVGLLLGPVYPCATAVFSRLLPRNIQMSSLSFISAMGSSGGAVSPFFTGLLAQHVGTVVLHPICIGLYGVMVTSWVCLPRISKRSE
ncbi:putative MFS efflux transporter [Thermoascus aurantiacus ATCC 26904]